VVIVNVTRDDLRDEFAMSDETFALSPISARAAQPSEADYDAIREAFMETSRGRWFLGEYAKRNRNADTRLVLDAVARIEETLAAQRTPAPDAGLADALIGIRAALEEARAAAFGAVGGLALEENLAPVRKGARVIREIAWRLREIGADIRICDLIDSQVSVIEGASGKMAGFDPATALSAAFDLIEGRIAGFDDSGAQKLAERMAEFSLPAAEVEAEQAASGAESAGGNPAGEPTAAPTEDAEFMFEPANMSAETTDLDDEAMLELVALEMAAPDSDEAYDPPESETYEVETAGLPPDEPVLAAGKPDRVAAAAVQTPPEPSAASLFESSLELSLEPSLEVSLGSSLIANGIVPRPSTSRPDPLAPIRRMSQTEKIALFS
jgi:hypothetical protein